MKHSRDLMIRESAVIPVQKKVWNLSDPTSLTALLSTAAGRPADSVMAAMAAACLKHFDDYGMTANERVAEFLANIAHETGGFTKFVENLNYTRVDTIRRVWPTRFPNNASAASYIHNPEGLANKVYARPAEGNTAPGDGWKYRGRGALQITFRNNYAAAGQRVGVDLVTNPDLAADPALSILLALDFWRRADVNAAVDQGDFTKSRKLVNGGSIGLDDVAHIRNLLLGAMA